jgi:hypothetical protein
MTVGCLLKDDMFWLQATFADAAKIAATKTIGRGTMVTSLNTASRALKVDYDGVLLNAVAA